jgi:hypothetical protein
MPKRRIERFYYRNGQIRMENREVGGGFMVFAALGITTANWPRNCATATVGCTASAGNGMKGDAC